MNRRQSLFVLVIVSAVVASTAGAYPLTNIVLDDNEAGWFTMQNMQAYGDDLDARGEGEVVVFTGHPSYVVASEEARLLFDMPRIHYYATTFNGSPTGDRFYRRLVRAIHSGQAEYAISGSMTERILRQRPTAERAFARHYCEVPDDDLYEETGATLYEWRPAGECPADRQPRVEDVSHRR